MKKLQAATDLQIIKKQLFLLADTALHLEINSDTALKEAVSILSQLNQFNDKIVEEREKVTKPLNEALKAERARWKPTELQNTQAIEAIRSKMTIYQTNLINTRKAEEDAIVRRVGDGKWHIKLETAVNRIEALEVVEKEHATEEGLVQFRATPTLKVTDITKIAREYFDLNEGKLLKDLKAGKLVEGAEIEITQTPINYR